MKLTSILISPRTATLKTTGIDTQPLKTTVEILLISLSLTQEVEFFLSYSNLKRRRHASHTLGRAASSGMEAFVKCSSQYV